MAARVALVEPDTAYMHADFQDGSIKATSKKDKLKVIRTQTLNRLNCFWAARLAFSILVSLSSFPRTVALTREMHT